MRYGRLLIAVAVIPVIVWLVVHATEDENRGVPRAAAITPMDARAFVDSIGVNVHLWYGTTPYADYAMVKRRLKELGIRHIRDGFPPEGAPTFLDRVNDLHRSGIGSTLIACRVEPPGRPWSTYVREAKTRVRRALEALEGVNEPDLVAPGTDWWSPARACQRRILRQARGDIFGAPLEVPVLGPSVQADNGQLGDLTRSADGGAVHPYPGGQTPGSSNYYTFTEQVADVRRNQFRGRRVPVYATETGYHDALNTTDAVNPPTSPRAVAIYLPRVFLGFALAGVTRTFAYELVDEQPDPGLTDPELNFGLFEADWSPKPSAVALGNLVKLLDSPRASRRQPLRLRLGNTADPDGPGPRGIIRHLLLQKADRSYWLALWQESRAWDEVARTDIENPATPVSVRLPRQMRLRTYDPTQSSSGTPRGIGRKLTVDVGDDVVLVRMR